jgi:ABC-type dipeptide/oligopeptide/nickel transport system permease component
MLTFILRRVLSDDSCYPYCRIGYPLYDAPASIGTLLPRKELPAQIIKNLEARYHVDNPLWKQYVDYMGNLLRDDLGPSFKYTDRTVNNIINDRFPVSAILGVAAARNHRRHRYPHRHDKGNSIPDG